MSLPPAKAPDDPVRPRPSPPLATYSTPLPGPLYRAAETGLAPRAVDGPGIPAAISTWNGSGVSSRMAVELATDAVSAAPERIAARLERLIEGGADPVDLCLTLLAPAARHLGQLWVDDALDFVDVTLGTMRLERALRGMMMNIPPPRSAKGAPTILMMPLPGNQHTFGLSMAADFFRRAGWIVSDASIFGAPGASPADLHGLERHLRFTALDAIGVAVSCETQIELLGRTLHTIRAASCNPRIRIALGGPLFLAQPGLASRFDADLVVTDGASAPNRLLSMVPDLERRRPLPVAASARGF